MIRGPVESIINFHPQNYICCFRCVAKGNLEEFTLTRSLKLWVGGLEKNHEERSEIIYALHDATGGGDTKNLVIRIHTQTRVPKIRQHSSSRAPKSPPSHQCNPTNSQFGKRERDLTYFACKRTRSGTFQAAPPLKEK